MKVMWWKELDFIPKVDKMKLKRSKGQRIYVCYPVLEHAFKLCLELTSDWLCAVKNLQTHGHVFIILGVWPKFDRCQIPLLFHVVFHFLSVSILSFPSSFSTFYPHHPLFFLFCLFFFSSRREHSQPQT